MFKKCNDLLAYYNYLFADIWKKCQYKLSIFIFDFTI